MKNHFILIICLFLVSCSTPEKSDSDAASAIRIDLDSVYDAPGRGTLILYPISGMDDGLYRKITFPDLSGISDTAFAEIFFTGNNHAAIANGVLVLVGNHASASPMIWVDYNNDLDFSDSKEPVQFSKDFIEISIPDMKKSQLVHTIRFHKGDPARKAQIKESLEMYITKGEKYSDFFFDERRNILVGDFVYKQDSLRIGLMDWNVNGSYNDLGEDRIVIGAYGGEISGIEEASGAVILDTTTFFQGVSYAFEVLKVSDDGTSISIKPALPDKLKDQIAKGESIPDYPFKLFPDKETSFYKHMDGKKYLYLAFWASWCSGCLQEVEYLKKIHAGYSDKITIISLNYNEDNKRVTSFMDKYSVDWLSGFATQEINEGLLIQGLPRNILVDPSGKIVEMNIHPSELLERMDRF